VENPRNGFFLLHTLHAVILNLHPALKYRHRFKECSGQYQAAFGRNTKYLRLFNRNKNICAFSIEKKYYVFVKETQNIASLRIQ